MAISPMIPVLATSSMVALPWNKVSLPPGMATPTALALDFAIHSPLLISLGVISQDIGKPPFASHGEEGGEDLFKSSSDALFADSEEVSDEFGPET
eukprot:12000670-Heterocapsa_arctica.AAC.1